MLKISRKVTYSDKLRKYRIYIDDVYCGDISANETREYDITPGKHTVCAKIDWCGSNIVSIETDEAVKELEVGCSLVGWRFALALCYITFLKNQYLWLKEID